MTTTESEPMVLAADFPPQSKEQWQTLAARVVNRSRAEGAQLGVEEAVRTLRTELPGDLIIDPLYVRPTEARPLGVPGRMPFTRGRAPRESIIWAVSQHHDDPDVETTRAAVAADLAGGVDTLWLKIGGDGIAPGDIASVLDGVDLSTIAVSACSWDSQEAAADALLEVARTAAGPAGGIRRVGLGLDPVTCAARAGGAPDLDGLAARVRAADEIDGVTAITVDTRVYHDTGADVVDELAIALATGVAYLRRLEAEGIAPAQAWRHVDFRLVASADQFLTIATLRAFRRVWARVGEALGIPEGERGARIHAVESLRMLTRDDPWVNILRGTLACFGAAVGGADEITVLPYDFVAGLPDPFSRRVARNTQLLLAHESNIGRVDDPAGGNWYVEALTDEIATKTWHAFQDIERGGGIVQALTDGTIAELIHEARAGVDEQVAERRAPITGVSMFPNAAEARLQRRARATIPEGPGALHPRRDAAAYEQLRDRAAAATAAGAPPTVALALLGDRRDFGARETFVKNLLAAGGIGTTEDAAGARVAILCSSPKRYAAEGAAALERLRAAGVATVLVAGRARELGDAASGVDGEVYDGMDVVAFVGGLLDDLGAPKEGTTR